LIALIFPGNKILPLGGIIAIGLTPALLVVTRGKIIRMILIGSVMIPVFFLSGTAIAPFFTQTAKAVGAFPENVADNVMITHSTLEGPVEKFLAILVGKLGGNWNMQNLLLTALAFAAYILLFVWYLKQMKKRNRQYEVEKETIAG
jgi:galactose PTS system EIIC component